MRYGTEFYTQCAMRTLPATAFAALLARATVSQAGFARLAGLTPRQVNNWCRSRAAVPRWAAALAVLLDEHSPEAITLLVEEAALAWHDTAARCPAPTPTPSVLRCAGSRCATIPTRAG